MLKIRQLQAKKLVFKKVVIPVWCINIVLCQGVEFFF